MFNHCLNNPCNTSDYTGEDPAPSWTRRINNGSTTRYGYYKALSVNAAAWAGAAGMLIFYLVANDVTVIGIADDVAIAPLLPVIWDNMQIITS